MFTFFMWLGTFGKNRALQIVFFTLWILFFLLAIHFWFDAGVVGKIAGSEGIIYGDSAIYLAMAEIVNENFGKPVMPIRGNIKVMLLSGWQNLKPLFRK